MNYSSPCKNCAARQSEPINCHTICEKYLDYQKTRENERKRRNKEHELDYYISQSEGNRIQKISKGYKPSAFQRNNQKKGKGI